MLFLVIKLTQNLPNILTQNLGPFTGFAKKKKKQMSLFYSKDDVATHLNVSVLFPFPICVRVGVKERRKEGCSVVGLREGDGDRHSKGERDNNGTENTWRAKYPTPICVDLIVQVSEPSGLPAVPFRFPGREIG
jgi:hypothetical protein